MLRLKTEMYQQQIKGKFRKQTQTEKPFGELQDRKQEKRVQMNTSHDDVKMAKNYGTHFG